MVHLELIYRVITPKHKYWQMQHTTGFSVPVYGVQNAVDTVESKESDPIDLKTDYPEYWLMK